MNTIITSKFRFFQEVIEVGFLNSVELGESSFCKAPKWLYSIDMLVSSCKLIFSMMYSIAFLVYNTYQSIIRWLSITINFSIFNLHFSSDDRYESSRFYIRNYLCIYLPISFQEPKYNSFHSSSLPLFHLTLVGQK